MTSTVIINGKPSTISSNTLPRRASILTDVFARAALSDEFKRKKVENMSIIALLYFEDANPNVDKLRNTIGKKMLQYDRLSSLYTLIDNKVHIKPISHEDIDLNYHIQSVDGNGTFDEDDVNELITTAQYETVDTSKPLWKIKIISKLKDGRSLIFFKLHHALGDGSYMLNVLMSTLVDSPQEEDGIQNRHPQKVQTSSLRWSHRLTLFLQGCYDGLIGWLIEPNDEENSLKTLLQTTGKSSKTFHQTKAFDLDEIKKAKNKIEDVTVNDILSAALSIGIRRYFEKTNDPIIANIDKGTQLHMMAAVSTRGIDVLSDDERKRLGNAFSSVRIPMILSNLDPLTVLWKSKAMMDYLKLSPKIYLMWKLGSRLLMMMPEKELADATVGSVLKPTMIMSNVIGPPCKCTIGGYVLDDINFILTSQFNLYIGIISYANKLHVSFATNKEANINCSLLKECIETGIESLQETIINHPDEIIKKPDMTPLSAKILEYCFLPIIASAIYMLWQR